MKGNSLNPRETPQVALSPWPGRLSRGLTLRAGAPQGTMRRCAACQCPGMGCATRLAWHPGAPRWQQVLWLLLGQPLLGSFLPGTPWRKASATAAMWSFR